jgi:hypothetical protein
MSSRNHSAPPSSWDDGQIDEDGPVTVGDWQAIDSAHNAMRESFPRSTPPFQPASRQFSEEVPPPTDRQLQFVDADHPVNFEASVRALASIHATDLLTKGAVFVGRDANRAILTHRHDGTYFLSYFDSGESKPWKTATYISLESAITALTGRQLYYLDSAEHCAGGLAVSPMVSTCRMTVGVSYDLA